jgi:Fic family protein
MEFISIKEAAKRWGLTERMVRGYCNEKRIEGAIFENRTWLIPEDAEKPQRRTTKPPKKEKPVSNSLVKRILYEKGKNNHYGIYEYIQVNLTYSSNRMASNRLIRDQVVDLFRTDKVSVSFEPMKIDDLLETIAHFDCVRIIIDNLSTPITEELVKRLHKVLFYGTYADRKKEVRPGCYRKDVRKWGTQPEYIEKELHALIKWYEKMPQPTMEDVLEFHVRFEKIHPFEDGNGRVGRLLLMKECLRYNIEPFIIDDKRRSRYNTGIATWHADHGPLMEVCIEAQERFHAHEELCKLMLYHRPPTGRGTK